MRQALLTTALVALAGCRHAYFGVYERWTREAEPFAWSTLSEVAHVSATYESDEFREAYVQKYAEDHALTDASRLAMLEDSRSDSATRHRFFVTFGVPVFREGDFSNERSDWRVTLVTPDGTQTEPTELTEIRRPGRDLLTYFPTISRQRHTYRIAFPRAREDGSEVVPAGADHFLLRFSSAAGQVELRWDRQ